MSYPNTKGRVGDYLYIHAGPNQYVVKHRDTGVVEGHYTQLSQAFSAAQRAHERDTIPCDIPWVS